MKIEPVVIEMRIVDGKPKPSVVTYWPACAAIDVRLLRTSPFITIDDEGRIVITVENGAARYKLSPEQHPDDFAVTVSLIDGDRAEVADA